MDASAASWAGAGPRRRYRAAVRVARGNHDPRLRRRALFWLGQSGDPRALDELEAVLRRR